jgi:hypothetical protein
MAAVRQQSGDLRPGQVAKSCDLTGAVMVSLGTGSSGHPISTMRPVGGDWPDGRGRCSNVCSTASPIPPRINVGRCSESDMCGSAGAARDYGHG